MAVSAVGSSRKGRWRNKFAGDGGSIARRRKITFPKQETVSVAYFCVVFLALAIIANLSRRQPLRNEERGRKEKRLDS
jgi:hypothetical protein